MIQAVQTTYFPMNRNYLTKHMPYKLNHYYYYTYTYTGIDVSFIKKLLFFQNNFEIHHYPYFSDKLSNEI